MKLWYAKPSPFARKALVIILEAGLSSRVDLLEVDAATLDAKVCGDNPQGKIPCLITDDNACSTAGSFANTWTLPSTKLGCIRLLVLHAGRRCGFRPWPTALWMRRYPTATKASVQTAKPLPPG
mgnify:CR=1 FL=1